MIIKIKGFAKLVNFIKDKFKLAIGIRIRQKLTNLTNFNIRNWIFKKCER